MLCKVPRCTVDATGQMVVCGPHWTLLPVRVRRELIDAEAALVAERAVANVRRATRDAWRALCAEAVASCEEARGFLSEFAGKELPADGLVLRREARRAGEEQLAADVGLLLEMEGPADREIVSYWTRS